MTFDWMNELLVAGSILGEAAGSTAKPRRPCTSS